MTLQVSNIAGDGRHVAKPRELPRHAEVYAPPDNWRGVKARKDSKEPAGLQQGYSTGRGATGRRRDDEAPQVTSTTGDGRHMVTLCGFPDGHYKEAGYRKTQQCDQTS